MSTKDTEKIIKNNQNNDAETICFENGMLLQILPLSTCNQYNARFLISDGLKFDLEMALDINNIPTPNFPALNGFTNISNSLDYVLKRKAGNLFKKGFFDLSIICLRKANQLMSMSPIHWSKKDYFYIVLELARAGKFEEAKQEKIFIENHYFAKYDFSTIHKTVLHKELEACQQLETDLVESDSAPNCNELCAKYRKRIYSLSGKDKRFSAMTDEIYNSGLIFYPFVDGISQPKYCTLDTMLEYNNRPFLDDRTDDEKDNHIKYAKQNTFDNNYATDFLEYAQICAYIPLLKPKSLKAYQEIKYANTVNFQVLVLAAVKAGIDIELTTKV